MHRWQVSQLLQKGTERTHDSLLSDLALAARFIVVTARARILGHFFSVAQAIRALCTGLLKIVDMIIGLPSLLAHNLEYKIKEERCRFLVAELVCRVSKKLLCSFILFYKMILKNNNKLKSLLNINELEFHQMKYKLY